MDRSVCVHVYIATDGKWHKIGMAKDVEQRRVKLGGNRANISIVRSWHRPGQAADIEREIKGALRDRRVLGFEWFKVPQSEIVAVAERVIADFDKQIAEKLGIADSSIYGNFPGGRRGVIREALRTKTKRR